ncbi:MAG: hypothetical protein WCK80_04290, partial [bacterium]
MANTSNSKEHNLLSKANAVTVGIVGVASFVVVFCLVASSSLFSQNKYQAKVASAKSKANSQLDANIKAYSDLNTSYKKFISNSPNAIGGNVNGTADNDGNNAKIVLNSLPSTYDFPALTSSLEKILHDRNITIKSITGTDAQASQSAGESQSPTPVAIPFVFTVSANYGSTQQLLVALQKSIRPIQIDSIAIAGASSDMTVTVNGHTYY